MNKSEYNKHNLKIILLSNFLLLILTFIAFYPSLKSDFTKLDDHLYVTENPTIMALTGENIKKIFTSFYVGCYLPLTMLSYSLEYYFFKLNPLVYHTTNLILHLLNCLLVFWLIFIISNKITPSFLTAIFFGIHPLHVESVAWISERKDVLSTCFFLLAIIFYLFYRKKNLKKYYYLSLLIFILSLLAKTIGITLPLVLLLFDYLFTRKFDRNAIIEKIPFFILAFIFGIIAIFAQNSVGAIQNSPSYTYFDNIFIASYGLVFYLSKMLVPINLSSIYPYPKKIHDLLPIPFLISPLIVLALITTMFFLIKKNRKISFGILFYLITILPVIKIIPIGRAIAADRYMYIPSIGLFYIISEGFSWLYFKKFNYKIILVLCLIIVIGTLSFLTWERCQVWRDSITLWSNVIKQYQDIPFAYYNLGIFYELKGDYESAIFNYNQAIKVNPNYFDAYINLGNTYYKKKEYDRAILDYNQALLLKPNSPMAYTSRGNIYFDKGDYKKALNDYEQALKVDPNFSEAYNNRGTFYGSLKKYDKALSDFNQALTINPANVQAYYNRAFTYYKMKKYEKAMEDLIKIKSMGYQIDPKFLEEINKALNK